MGTTSSPVEMMATRGARRTATSFCPKEASRPISCGRSLRPAGMMQSPAAASSSRMTTWSPGAWVRVSSTMLPPAGREYSTMTTQSAPSGSMPPVRMRAHWPGWRLMSGTAPMGQSPTHSSRAGEPSCAPKTSRARTANPSTVERSKPGRSAGACRASARRRPRASVRGTVSAGRTGRARRCPSTVSTDCRVKKFFMASPCAPA